MKPLCVDLYAGLGGWSAGFLAEGYECWGFDIERHDYGRGGYPGQLVLYDCLTLDGKQFKDATVIVGSSPCQEFSYRAMPWKRAKALPPPYKGMELFQAQFRIQREASEAAGRKIPMVVENVKGAQPWVGRAKWHYGSFYLWGDVPALMPFASGWKTPSNMPKDAKYGRRFPLYGTNNPLLDGQKVPGFNFHEHEKTGKPGGSFQSAAVASMDDGRKGPGGDWFADGRQGQDACAEAIKNRGGSWFNQAHNTESGHGQNPDGRKQEGSGAAWFDNGLCKLPSGSSRRAQASAKIAMIPFPLAQHIARTFYPSTGCAQ